MIPALENGLLPEGIWDCTLTEIETTFSTSPHRAILFERLRQFFNEHSALPSAPVFVDGSYVTNKQTPSDIDICVDLDALPEADRAGWQRIFYAERSILKSQGIDFWFRSPDFPEDVSETEFPRIKAVEAERLGLPKQTRKGFLRLLR